MSFPNSSLPISLKWYGQRLAAATVCIFTLFISSSNSADGAESDLQQTTLYEKGKEGYHTYRIPSIIVAKNGSLLAFCEGRKASRSDAGDIDLLLRRSDDGGKTWSKQMIVWDDAKNTCGNPCPVVDQETGAISLLVTWNAGKIGESKIKPGFGADSRRVFLLRSTDDGQTWSQPKNITANVKQENWTWYATGPGAGIQVMHGKYRGRLVVACDHKAAAGDSQKTKYYSHVIYSDDRGETWQAGKATPTDNVNECEVVELEGGRLLLNMRNYDRASRTRQIAFSDDGGQTWRDQRFDEALIEPTCQASIRRHSWAKGDKPGVIVFSNPASLKRENLTVRASFDDGKTWPVKRVLEKGPAAYSSLIVRADGRIGCLYESNDYGKLIFALFPLDSLK